MKILRFAFVFFILAASVVGCKYDDEELWNRVNSLEERIESLEEQLTSMNQDISSISTVVNALQNDLSVTSIEETDDGYTITFSDDQKITIKNGTDGEDGSDAPIIGVDLFEGKYYWTQTIDGTKTWLTDAKGNKFPVAGESGVTPRLKVSATGHWMVSYDNGISYTEVLDEKGKPVQAVGKDGEDGEDGKDGHNGSSGSDGKDGDSFFKDVKVDGDELVLVLKDGMEIKIPFTGEVETDEGTTIVSGSIDLEDVEGLKIESLTGEQTLDNDNFSISVSDLEESPQLLFVTNQDDAVIMMARSFFSNDNNKIGVESTAFALVASHPVFAPVPREDFNEVKEMILASPRFQTLCDEVQKSVDAQRDIFDTTNTELLVALNNVFEDLCANEPNIEEILRASVATRAAELDIDTYPFYVEPGTNSIIIRNTNLTPPYEYTVKRRDENNVWNIIYDQGMLPTRESYGWKDMFKPASQIHLGDPIEVAFSIDGEYLFCFDKTTEKAVNEFQKVLMQDALSIIGGRDIGSELISVTGDITSMFLSGADPFDYIKYIADKIKEYRDELVNGPKDPGKMAQFLNRFNLLYNGITGTANETLRILWGFQAPLTVEFCVSCFEGEISSCSQSGLQITSGNEQEGYANQRLLLPLEVHVTSLNPDDWTEAQPGYHKVKFEVLTGGGSVSETIVGTNDEGYAQTYWTLGEGEPGDEQKVKVTVLDITTGAEISDPKYFTATIKEPSDITIRLDWHKLSGNTDIDLHVVDPFGEEIYFAHMQSASGGWLDRDDVIGPGPEHVYWEDAPAGTYTVKVHYFGSESQAVTSYQVTINANGQTYGPFTGSLGYHQEVVIGTFTIPESTTRSAGSTFIEKNEIYENKQYEKKSYQK